MFNFHVTSCTVLMYNFTFKRLLSLECPATYECQAGTDTVTSDPLDQCVASQMYDLQIAPSCLLRSVFWCVTG